MSNSLLQSVLQHGKSLWKQQNLAKFNTHTHKQHAARMMLFHKICKNYDDDENDNRFVECGFYPTEQTKQIIAIGIFHAMIIKP